MLDSSRIPPPGKAPRVVRAKHLAEWLEVTENTIFAWVKKGILPAPVELGPRTRLFNLEAVRTALQKVEAGEVVSLPLMSQNQGGN